MSKKYDDNIEQTTLPLVYDLHELVGLSFYFTPDEDEDPDSLLARLHRQNCELIKRPRRKPYSGPQTPRFKSTCHEPNRKTTPRSCHVRGSIERQKIWGVENILRPQMHYLLHHRGDQTPYQGGIMRISCKTIEHIVFDDEGNTFLRYEKTKGINPGLRWIWISSGHMNGTRVGKQRAKKLEQQFQNL